MKWKFDLVHSMLVTLVLFVGYYLGNYIFQVYFNNILVMFVWFVIVIMGGDYLIHKVIGKG